MAFPPGFEMVFEGRFLFDKRKPGEVAKVLSELAVTVFAAGAAGLVGKTVGGEVESLAAVERDYVVFEGLGFAAEPAADGSAVTLDLFQNGATIVFLNENQRPAGAGKAEFPAFQVDAAKADIHAAEIVEV
jgi:hypothetical protein